MHYEFNLVSTLNLMMLSKRERNTIYETIVKEKLDPAEFDLEDTGDRVVITHNSGSTFEFSPKTANLYLVFGSIEDDDPFASTEYKVRAIVSEGIKETMAAPSIYYVTTVSIPRWLREIKLTVGVPDYWTELQRSRKSIAIIQRGDFGNTPFTQAEQEQIVAQLQEIKKQVKEQFALSSEQMERIAERLDEAGEASKRMGRKDWLLLFSGIIFTLIIASTVTPDVADHIFTMAINGLIHLFTDGSEPPQMPPPILT
jgi:integrase